MTWKRHLNDDPLPWLLESGPDNSGVRYSTLTDLPERPADDAELVAARQAIMETGPVPTIEAAIQTGVEFLLSRDPALADYPAGWSDKPSRSWFRFGFPVFYVTDVLQSLEALTSLGLGSDPRLKSALELMLSKQDKQGRWKMEYTYKGKTWADMEKKGQPSKWVTLRALRVLKGVYG
ncbi:MAG TPA: hypothetical protein DCP08_06640 [Chloroflexi bacterium]|nr:hypothetical protein [Chloroflexota bacterium]